jgi:hypothetical protein
VITNYHHSRSCVLIASGPARGRQRLQAQLRLRRSDRNYYNSHGGVETPSRNFRARDNKVAPPRFVDARHGDLNLRPNSGCRSL